MHVGHILGSQPRHEYNGRLAFHPSTLYSISEHVGSIVRCALTFEKYLLIKACTAKSWFAELLLWMLSKGFVCVSFSI